MQLRRSLTTERVECEQGAHLQPPRHVMGHNARDLARRTREPSPRLVQQRQRHVTECPHLGRARESRQDARQPVAANDVVRVQQDVGERDPDCQRSRSHQ